MGEVYIVNNYRSKQSHLIGALLVTSGCFSIVFNIVDLGISADLKEQRGLLITSLQSLGYVFHGIWCGVACIITGSFGIAAKNKNSCLITAFMALSIICVFLCVGQCVIGLAGAVMCSERGQKDYGCATSSVDVICDAFHALVAMEALLCILGFACVILCIWGAAIAGKSRRSNRDSSLPVSFMSAGSGKPGGQPMTFAAYQITKQQST